jgi:hypothetical protein
METVDSLPFQVILLPTWKKCTCAYFSQKVASAMAFPLPGCFHLAVP